MGLAGREGKKSLEEVVRRGNGSSLICARSKVLRDAPHTHTLSLSHTSTRAHLSIY